MIKIIKLEKSDIKTAQFYENVQIEVSDDFKILLSRDAADELKNDLIELAERWQNWQGLNAALEDDTEDTYKRDPNEL